MESFEGGPAPQPRDEAARAPSAPRDAGPVRVPRIRCRAAGRVEDLPLDAVGAPLLVPTARDGARLAALLLEALDRAAIDGDEHVTIERDGIEVGIDIPGSWPRPGQPPSVALGGSNAARPDPDAADRQDALLLRRALAIVGADGVEALRDFPRRRRTLAARRRRLESELWQLDQQLRWRTRTGFGLAVLALGGFGAAAFGAAARFHEALLPAGAAFALGALGWSALQSGLVLRRERRARRAVRLEQALARADAIDREAVEMAHAIGRDDPWEMAARLERAGRRYVQLLRRTRPADEALALARALAEDLGVDPVLVEDPAAWALPVPGETQGWPLDVGADEAEIGPAQAAIGLARLLDRAARTLPEPWPIVMWDPWPSAPSADRARRLVAAARLAGARPLVAFVPVSAG